MIKNIKLKNMHWTYPTLLIVSLTLISCGSGSGGSDGGSVSLLKPIILSIEGTIAEGAIITISGSSFTEKTNAKPLLWWKADMGNSPSNLGRKTAWDSSFNGEDSRIIVAPGSTQAFRWDHGASSGAALAKVEFGVEASQIYLHRKLYEDFNVVEDFALRTRVNITAGTVPIVGDIITGVSSTATGRVSKVEDDVLINVRTHAIFYNNVDESINDSTPTDFEFNEGMTTSSINPVTMSNAEGSIAFPTGLSRSFNQKTIRFWNYGQQNNVYIAAQGANNMKFDIVREYTDATLFNKDFNNLLVQIPDQWNIEEIVYKSSSNVDVSDARWDYYQNGVIASDQTFISRTTARPAPYSSVFQSQVSNGAQMGSYAYYDSLYIDDSWHRVLICTGATIDLCTSREIQIPKSWTSEKIELELNLGPLDPMNALAPLYLYVINGNGISNSEGKQITQ